MMTQDNTMPGTGGQGSLPSWFGNQAGGTSQSQGTQAAAAAATPASNQGMIQLLIMGLLGGF